MDIHVVNLVKAFIQSQFYTAPWQKIVEDNELQNPSQLVLDRL